MTAPSLVEFLLARIAKDEAVAQEVAAERIRVGELIDYPAHGDDRSFWADFDGAGPSVSVGAHRVLAECEAKRSIVGEHAGPFQCVTCYEGDDYGEGPEGDTTSYAVMKPWPCPTLRFLALPYADHPDFRTEWRP